MATSDFKVTTEQVQQPGKEPITVFNLRGWLDAQSETSFLSAAQEAHTLGSHKIIIHMEELAMLTSAGIRILQKIHKLYSTSETSTQPAFMKLCSAQPQVYHALSLTGFLHTAPMYENLQSAIASFEK